LLYRVLIIFVLWQFSSKMPVYLDNAASGVASPQQLEAYAKSLLNTPLSNPHSRHATAQQTFALVENARSR
jgi:cysteine sulfinate desulfinase/cysteine desulfurase-like protein